MRKSSGFQKIKRVRKGVPLTKPKKIAAAVIAAAVFAVLLFALIRYIHRRNYNYIDLPIVLTNEEDVVQTIRGGLVNRNDTVRISFNAQGQYSDQLVTLADSLFAKALEPTGDPKEGDYLKFQYGGYTVKYSSPQNASGGYDYTIRILPTYYTNSSQEEMVDQVIQEFLADAAFTSRTPDYEKIRTAHDFLTESCEYDWRNRNLMYRHTKSTAYGALVNGEASCQGYSVAMYRLLMESGIPCRVITGDATSPETGETEYHAWNLVRCGEAWYNLDASWDDETESDDYFLKSDDTFSSHVREEQYDDAAFRGAYPVSETDWSASGQQ